MALLAGTDGVAVDDHVACQQGVRSSHWGMNSPVGCVFQIDNTADYMILETKGTAGPVFLEMRLRYSTGGNMPRV